MTASTIARPTNVRTRPPPLDAVWVGPAAGRVSGVSSPVGLEAARAGGAASSMPAQAAARAVRRVGNILEGEPGEGERVDPVIGAVPQGLEPTPPTTSAIGSDARAGGRRIEHSSSRLSAAPRRSMTRTVSSPHFSFRLERVRVLRERAEDQAKEEYAASLAHRLEGAALLRAAAETRDRARSDARTAPTGASGMDLLASQAWLDRLELARQAAELELDRRDAEVEARHVALVNAARERHALERLSQKRRAEHALETNRREAYELDELAAAGHRRKVLA